MHCNEVVQAVWGEKEMQDGNLQEEVRQERIRILAAKRVEEVARQCTISNAEHKAKYAAIVRRARMAKLTNSLPSEEEELQTPVAKLISGPKLTAAERSSGASSCGEPSGASTRRDMYRQFQCSKCLEALVVRLEYW